MTPATAFGCWTIRAAADEDEELGVAVTVPFVT